jgi:predicted negative regulator of RcsB-dependent stress response
MVSVVKSVFAAAIATTLLAQQPAPQAFTESRTPTTTQPAAIAPKSTPSALSPEMRGDIFMARKMYREAVEAYTSGSKDSAVLANKTGIAWHQLLDPARPGAFTNGH